MPEKMYALSTVDNPYNPFDEFDKWLQYDISRGYNCCGILADITSTSRELPFSMQTEDINEAIDRFISVAPDAVYVKVEKPYLS